MLDLSGTLVHSSFRAIPEYDFTVAVEMDKTVHTAYVAKRPCVEEFLKECSKYYEIVVWAVSSQKYVDPVLGKSHSENTQLSL